MKINFTKKQYEHLILLSQLAGSILGILGDGADKKYKKDSDENEDFEDYILGFANEFGMGGIVDKSEYDGKKHLDDELYEKYFKIIEEYNEFIMWDELAHKLARRDFYRTATKEELKECEETGMLNARYGGLVDNYWDEFEKNGLENIGIKKK